MTGYALLLNYAEIVYYSKSQSTTATSGTEAKFLDVVNVAKPEKYLCAVLRLSTKQLNSRLRRQYIYR